MCLSKNLNVATFADLFADPVVRMVMRADHVTEQQLMELIGATLIRDEMNQDSKRDAAANPRMEETAMLWKRSSLDSKIKDKRIADVLWWILMAMRFVIPAYIIYVVYLYWTTPLAPYLQGPR